METTQLDKVLASVRLTSQLVDDMASDSNVQSRITTLLGRNEPLLTRATPNSARSDSVTIGTRTVAFEECANEGTRPISDYNPLMTILWILGKANPADAESLILDLRSNRPDFQVAYFVGTNPQRRSSQPLLPSTILRDWRLFTATTTGRPFLDEGNSYINLDSQDMYFSDVSQQIFLTFLSMYSVKYGSDGWRRVYNPDEKVLSKGIVKESGPGLPWNDWFRHTTNHAIQVLKDVCNMFSVGCLLYYAND